MTEENQTPILFGPRTGKSLRKMYPELASEPIFKELTNEDLLFSWYLGNQSSPIDPNWSDELRYKTASAHACTDSDKRMRYANKDIPEAVMLAVEKMQTYSPRARDIAAKSLQNYFHNILKMSDVDVKKDFIYLDKEGNELIDFTARKQYMDAAKTASDLLPNLIKQIEDGFGIEKTKKEESGTKAIDKFHNQKREK